MVMGALEVFHFTLPLRVKYGRFSAPGQQERRKTVLSGKFTGNRETGTRFETRL